MTSLPVWKVYDGGCGCMVSTIRFDHQVISVANRLQAGYGRPYYNVCTELYISELYAGLRHTEISGTLVTSEKLCRTLDNFNLGVVHIKIWVNIF